MNFKDCIANDVSVFINAAEFAETHNVDGTNILCAVDKDLLNPKKTDVAGVYGSLKTLFVKAADLPDRPVIGQRITLDSARYTVISCDSNDGMLEIVMEAFDA